MRRSAGGCYEGVNSLACQHGAKGKRNLSFRKTTLAKQGAYLGVGAGLGLYGIFGLVPGVLLRGVVLFNSD